MPPVRTVRPNGPAIRELRLRRGLSVRDLAEITGPRGRHQQAIRHLENETRLASEVLIHQLANALEVDVSELILPDEPQMDAAA
jgi:transcriptional regulator with XRE-family HTH domain